MIMSRLKRTIRGIVLLPMALAFSVPAGAACPQEKIAEYVRDLGEMSEHSEKSIRYLIPQFRECGQGAIAAELDGTPEWLLAMRQQLLAQAASPVELKKAIETALVNLNKAETSLQKNYELVLGGIDSMYDNRFPPKCRRERPQILSAMKSVRPLVPSAIAKLSSFNTCLGT